MNTVMVRYKVKPEKVQEHIGLVERVFRALAQSGPKGLRYASFRLPDGLSFVHLSSLEDGVSENPLSQTPEFQEFIRDIKARCDEPPAPVALELIGNYRLVRD